MEKLFFLKILKKLPKLVGSIYSILLIIIGWVIFNSTDLYEIILILKNMFSNFELNSLVYVKNLRILYLWPYIIMAVLLSTPIIKKIGEKLDQTKIGEIIVNVILIIMLYWCILLLVNNSYNPFIYFRF
jgi:alginate O-acetyltransferase complex protein AlgI